MTQDRNQTTAPCHLSEFLIRSGVGRPIIMRQFVRRSDGYQLKAQLLGPLDEPVQMRLVGYSAGQHRGARTPL